MVEVGEDSGHMVEVHPYAEDDGDSVEEVGTWSQVVDRHNHLEAREDSVADFRLGAAVVSHCFLFSSGEELQQLHACFRLAAWLAYLPASGSSHHGVDKVAAHILCDEK